MGFIWNNNRISSILNNETGSQRARASTTATATAAATTTTTATTIATTITTVTITATAIATIIATALTTPATTHTAPFDPLDNSMYQNNNLSEEISKLFSFLKTMKREQKEY
ncbi:unnamed protein product [Rhizophagus irregularis]|nr:unnamed protein product [Rhizophagus irregularis]